jgi:CRISPR-associated protein Cas2
MKRYQERINAYRIMWIIVMYDLPMVTKKEKQHYAEFRKSMLADGFARFQFSMYLRHCSSREHADMHVDRVKKWLPPHGHIGIMTITDKQFGMMKIFKSREAIGGPGAPTQLVLF